MEIVFLTAYGAATVLALIAFIRVARKHNARFDWIDGIICSLLWPFILLLSFFADYDELDDGETER